MTIHYAAHLAFHDHHRSASPVGQTLTGFGTIVIASGPNLAVSQGRAKFGCDRAKTATSSDSVGRLKAKRGRVGVPSA